MNYLLVWGQVRGGLLSTFRSVFVSVSVCRLSVYLAKSHSFVLCLFHALSVSVSFFVSLSVSSPNPPPPSSPPRVFNKFYVIAVFVYTETLSVSGSISIATPHVFDEGETFCWVHGEVWGRGISMTCRRERITKSCVTSVSVFNSVASLRKCILVFSEK